MGICYLEFTENAARLFCSRTGLIQRKIDMYAHQFDNPLISPPVKNLKPVGEKPSLPIISVLLVVSNLHLCQSLGALLEFYNLSLYWEFNVIGEAVSQKQALSIAAQEKPTLILVDWDLFQQLDEGIKTLENLSNTASTPKRNSKILVMSSRGDETSIFYTMQAGACGYILKENLPTQLHVALTATLNDQVYLCPEVAARFFRIFHLYQEKCAAVEPEETGGEPKESNPANGCTLTHREREVLELLVKGYRNQEIAQNLYITVATVKAHLTAIFEKLGVNSRSRAIVKSLQLGWVEKGKP